MKQWVQLQQQQTGTRIVCVYVFIRQTIDLFFLTSQTLMFFI